MNTNRQSDWARAKALAPVPAPVPVPVPERAQVLRESVLAQVPAQVLESAQVRAADSAPDWASARDRSAMGLDSAPESA
jgi:hypothetical protein